MKKYTIKEKAENAIRWIDGLKTTTLLQGDGQLGDKATGFCCLGYGCYKAKIKYDPFSEFSTEFAESVGLREEDGDIEGGLDARHNHFASLAELNDSKLYSFRRISTIMKKRAADIFEPKVAAKIIKHYKKV